MLTAEQLQIDIDMKEQQVKVLTLDGEVLCAVDRQEALELEARISSMKEQLTLLLH